MYPDKVIYYLFDFDYVSSTLEPRSKLRQWELNPLQMGLMRIVLTFTAWCLVFLWTSLPVLLCKMIITFFSLYLKTNPLFRAPSHAGGRYLPTWSQGHITLFLLLENHSARLWGDKVSIFICLTTEHCFVFMREQWGVPQTRACILNEALASMLAGLRDGLRWLSPVVGVPVGRPLPRWLRADLSDQCNPVWVMLCDFWGSSLGGSQPPWCDDSSHVDCDKVYTAGLRPPFNSSPTLWWATLGLDLPHKTCERW